MTSDAANNPIKIIVAGLGNMGANHFRVLSKLPQFQIQAVLDPAPRHQDKLPHGTKIINEFKQLDEIDFEAAVVATPTETHFEVAKELLNRGKNLLLEKPLCSTVEQSEEIISLAQKKGLLLAIGHVERSNPAVKRLKEVIDGGWIGAPIHFSFTRVGGYPNNIKKGNNVLLDLAVHDLDVLRFLNGDYNIHSSVCHKSFQSDIPDTAEILLSGKSSSANIHVNWVTPTKIRTLRVTGTKGVAFVDYMLQTCTLHGGDLIKAKIKDSFNYHDLQSHYRNTDKIEFGVHREEPLVVQAQEWEKALRGQDHQMCLGPDGLKAVRLAEESLKISPILQSSSII